VGKQAGDRGEGGDGGTKGVGNEVKGRVSIDAKGELEVALAQGRIVLTGTNRGNKAGGGQGGGRSMAKATMADRQLGNGVGASGD
jgi:hypothetical protein